AVNDFAINRRVHIGCRLDGLDHAERLARLHGIAFVGKLEVRDIAKLLLCMVGETNGSDVALKQDPLVSPGVLPVFWCSHIGLSCHTSHKSPATDPSTEILRCCFALIEWRL